MAVKASVKLEGFDKLEDILDPAKFEKRLVKNITIATKKNALFAEKDVKDRISKGEFRKNKALTVVLKGSSKPLVATGELFKSITGEATTWSLARIGVLRNKIVKDDKGNTQDLIMIAKIVHDGAVVKVSEKMRRLFKWWAYGKDSPYVGMVRPLRESTKRIIIKGRPFLRTVLRKVNKDRYERNWTKAINKTFAGKS